MADTLQGLLSKLPDSDTLEDRRPFRIPEEKINPTSLLDRRPNIIPKDDIDPKEYEQKLSSDDIDPVLTPSEQKLLQREKEFYKKHPPSTLRLTPLGDTTKYGMPTYIDQHGARHSESTVTFSIEIGGKEKWVTVPSIWPGENMPTGDKELTGKYWNQEKLSSFVEENMSNDKKAFINPITQEKMPVFNKLKEAEKFAIERDMSLQFQKGGANMAETEELYDDMGAQMELAGLVSEPTDKDPVSGNDIPLGATAEGVRDDQTAAISPGEFVIPDYAVRYHGLDFYMESLQKATQGLQQMEQMGMVGNPDDATMSEEAPLPTMDMATEDEPLQFQTGGLTTTALTQVPKQQAIPQVPTVQQPTVPGQATQPVPVLTQPLRPTTTQPLPFAPSVVPQVGAGSQYLASQRDAAGYLQPQVAGYPEFQPRYQIEAFVNDQGNYIYLPTTGGKPQSGTLPPGYTRVRQDSLTSRGATGTGGLAPAEGSTIDVGEAAGAAATALGALAAFNTANKLSGGAIGTALKSILKATPGGGGIIEAIETTGGNIGEFVSGAITDFTTRISQGLGLSTPLTQVTGGLSGGSGLTGQGLTAGLDKLAAQRLGSQAATAAADVAAASPGAFAPPVAGGVQSIPALQAAATAAQAVPAVGQSISNIAAYGSEAAKAAYGAAAGTGVGIPIQATTGIEAATYGTLGNVTAGAGAATLGSWLGTIAPPIAAIMALPTIAGLSRSKNRLQAALQAGSAVERSLLNPDFNENNAARIRALTGLKGDTGQYGDVPSEGRVSSIGGALNRIQQAGGVDVIPSAAGKAMYNELLKEIERQELAKKRMSLGVSADDQEQYARLSPEEVEREYRYRQSGGGGNGNGG